MLDVRVVCVGKLKESYWRDACREYAKRLSAFCRFSIVEIGEERLPERPSPAQISRALEIEGEKLLAASSGGARISLCIEGKELSSPQLAEKIEALAVRGVSTVAFLIGSSYGLSGEVKRESDFLLSMSPMTFPHQLARVMACEQIYRAFEITGNGKYHK